MEKAISTLIFLSIFLAARAPAERQNVEIFGPDRILLGALPLNHLAHGIRICGDNLFLWERTTATVHQYRILEK
ncbi:MAG TPA: hypothetical protein DIW61_14395 [Candidatus Aminicenantes bacterium]|nr:hypothetical protein [Candidatus Aminicenantes bacterium]